MVELSPGAAISACPWASMARSGSPNWSRTDRRSSCRSCRRLSSASAVSTRKRYRSTRPPCSPDGPRDGNQTVQDGCVVIVDLERLCSRPPPRLPHRPTREEPEPHRGARAVAICSESPERARSALRPALGRPISKQRREPHHRSACPLVAFAEFHEGDRTPQRARVIQVLHPESRLSGAESRLGQQDPALIQDGRVEIGQLCQRAVTSESRSTSGAARVVAGNQSQTLGNTRSARSASSPRSSQMSRQFSRRMASFSWTSSARWKRSSLSRIVFFQSPAPRRWAARSRPRAASSRRGYAGLRCAESHLVLRQLASHLFQLVEGRLGLRQSVRVPSGQRQSVTGALRRRGSGSALAQVQLCQFFGRPAGGGVDTVGSSCDVTF